MSVSYSHALSLVCAQLSQAAYIRFESGPASVTELKAALLPLGFTLVATFNSQNTEAFLAYRAADDIHILSFRGTQPRQLTDVINDLDADIITAVDGTHVHEGFYRAFRPVETSIAQVLQSIAGRPLYFTGHSLGGALAVIATRFFQRFAPTACYTFGAPRVGQGDFYQGIPTPIFRVINALDMIPALPPADRDIWWLRLVIPIVFQSDKRMLERCTHMCERFRGFHHPPVPAYYITPGRGAAPDTLGTSVPGNRRWIWNYLRDVRGLKDHSIGLYVQRLKQIFDSGAPVPA